MTNKWVRTGNDYIPVPGEPYYPQGKPKSKDEEVLVLHEDAATAVVVGEDGIERHVPKSWLQR